MKPNRSGSARGCVVGGTVVLDGRPIVENCRRGRRHQFAGMVRLVEEAQIQKADAQRLADRIAGVLCPPWLGSRWSLSWCGCCSERSREAFAAGLAVLVIARPCAGSGNADGDDGGVRSGGTARDLPEGLSRVGGDSLRRHRGLRQDRNLTTGRLDVTTVTAAEGWEAAEIVAVAGAVETTSEHAVAMAIAAYAVKSAPLGAPGGCGGFPGVARNGSPDWLRAGASPWVAHRGSRAASRCPP